MKKLAIVMILLVVCVTEVLAYDLATESTQVLNMIQLILTAARELESLSNQQTQIQNQIVGLQAVANYQNQFGAINANSGQISILINQGINNGSLLTSQAGLAMLPYSKDGLNSKMALRFSDASVLQFKIPSPSFAIDLEVKGFKKVLNKSTDAESLWLYGAFLNVRVYEPEFNVVFYDAPAKYGVSKVVPISQKTIDEFPVVSEAMTGAFLTAIDQMQKNQTTNEKVLKKCQL